MYSYPGNGDSHILQDCAQRQYVFHLHFPVDVDNIKLYKNIIIFSSFENSLHRIPNTWDQLPRDFAVLDCN